MRERVVEQGRVGKRVGEEFRSHRIVTAGKTEDRAVRRIRWQRRPQKRKTCNVEHVTLPGGQVKVRAPGDAVDGQKQTTEKDGSHSGK